MTPPCATARRQAGYSLISMMVGLVISLLTVGAMLAIYKIAIEVSGNASRSAQRDGQTASALLAAQIELQQAGFGIDPGSAHVLAVVDQGRQVVWRYNASQGMDYRCAGLRLAEVADDPAIASTPADAGADRRGLYWLPDKPCTAADAELEWGDSAAERPRLLASSAAFFAPLDRQGNEQADEAGGFSLEGAVFVQQPGGACLPFAQQADTGADADERGGQAQRIVLRGGNGDELFAVCLPNVRSAGSQESAQEEDGQEEDEQGDEG